MSKSSTIATGHAYRVVYGEGAEEDSCPPSAREAAVINSSVAASISNGVTTGGSISDESNSASGSQGLTDGGSALVPSQKLKEAEARQSADK